MKSGAKPFHSGWRSLHNYCFTFTRYLKSFRLSTFTNLNSMTMEIPHGNSREDNKARKQIIKDYYASWIAQHPDKKIWNKSLNGYIHIKGQSINETAGHASLSFESTKAVFQLTEVLKEAIVREKWVPKYGDKNQKPYSVMYLLRWKDCRLIVGYQKSKGELVQYYIGSEQINK